MTLGPVSAAKTTNDVSSPPARRRRAGILLLVLVLLGVSCSSAGAVAANHPSLLAWGYNGEGELGNGGTVSSVVPTPVAGGAIPPGTTFTRVAVGEQHSLALSATGQLYAWGDNSLGELGDGTTTERHAPVAVARGAIAPGTKITEIAAGSGFSLALSASGQLYAWVHDTLGELGDGATTDSSVPVAVAPGDIPPGSKIAEIAAGGGFSLALSTTGQLYAWGDNTYGQLGKGTTSASLVPEVVAAGAIPLGTRITQIAAGWKHSLALGSTGQLYAWGYNAYGQLGDGTSAPASVPVAVSAGAIPAGAQITRIAAGVAHSLALSTSGQLYSWGADNHGQLGINSAADESAPSRVAMYDIRAGETIVQIVAGDSYSLALSASGHLYSWGENDTGQLGTGDTTDLSVPEAAATPAGITIASLAQGSQARHRMALTVSDGIGGGPFPIVSGLKIAPRAFAAATGGPSASTASVGSQVGAQVTYTLTIAAAVRFTAVRKLPGRVQGSGRHARCVALTGRNRRSRRCTRLVSVHGSFTRAGSGGANRFRFSGRLAGRRLKLGSYALMATPAGAPNTGRPVTVGFQIVGR